MLRVFTTRLSASIVQYTQPLSCNAQPCSYVIAHNSFLQAFVDQMAQGLRPKWVLISMKPYSDREGGSLVLLE